MFPPVGKSDEGRRHPRHPFACEFSLELENGRFVHAFSRDVSLGGIFLETDPDQTRELRPGVKALANMVLGDESLGFHCTVTRTSRDGIGITVNKDWGALGQAVTLHIFKQMSARLTAVRGV
ncbi:MAG: PilZ domain-containing protein [Magnetococcales bacterium]|nr:PilZ domain-containing protein [Magnetococcales bacterium]MBF0156874.1 PilZ domain-containing protein [Magnetococcales bacterium]